MAKALRNTKINHYSTGETMSVVTIYVTASTLDEAKNIARTIVGERLVACANILGHVSSVFHWDGAVQEETEVAMILKTRRDLVRAVTERIKEIHSYDCPCITAHDVVDGHGEFLSWILAETV
tara:strand:+ start:1198 stop:1566 length:369 start_codon:yes stop_codon:yes gene_type:complete